jgi:hypothetical protein
MAQGRKDVLASLEAPIELFSTGEVAKILDIDEGKLQKFLNSAPYKLDDKWTRGQKTGGRRDFRLFHLYRFGALLRLLNDGFVPGVAADAVRKISDRNLLGFDDFGSREHDFVLCLTRGGKTPVPQVVASQTAADTLQHCFYRLPLSDVRSEVDKLIDTRKKKKAKEKQK